MKKIKLSAVCILLIFVLALSGCSDITTSNYTIPDEPSNLTVSSKEYAYVYRPDGTLIAEGEFEYCIIDHGVVTIIINGITYKTGCANVLITWPA